MSEDTYTCEDVSCPQCRKTRIVSFKASSYASAKKLIKQLSMEICSICDGSYTPIKVKLNEINRVPEYKEPLIFVQDGRRYRRATVEEIRAMDAKVRHIKWNGILTNLGYKDYTPKFEHHFNCKCPQCQLTQLLIHEHRTGIYEHVLKQI